jgi:hypothetical protein
MTTGHLSNLCDLYIYAFRMVLGLLASEETDLT